MGIIDIQRLNANWTHELETLNVQLSTLNSQSRACRVSFKTANLRNIKTALSWNIKTAHGRRSVLRRIMGGAIAQEQEG